MKNLAPIILFVYNRLEHTQQTVEALKANYMAEESDIYIYSDGPKTEKDRESVQNVRNYIKGITGFKKVIVIYRERNMGLATSVISGVTEIINIYGRVIVVEDDLITSRFFLKYMNTALEKYQEEKKVFSITGYSFFENGNKKLPQTYFSALVSSWTWATWKDRWDLFEENPSDWIELKTNEKKRKLFDYDGCYNYTEMLIAQMEKRTIDSWAIRWYYTSFMRDGLTLYVNKSLCINQGFDGSGTHCGNTNKVNYVLESQEVNEFPTIISELPKIRRLLKKKIKNSQYLIRVKGFLHLFKFLGK